MPVSGPLVLEPFDRDADDSARPATMPSPWLLFLIVVALWWPIAPYWQSDDFVAVHWTANPLRALGDFFGPKYGVEGSVAFYRPLISAAFALDLSIARLLPGGMGGEYWAPFVSHLHNVVVHAANATLVGILAARFSGRGAAGFAAGLAWAVLPTHVTTITWAASRTATHTTFCALLAIWFADRYARRDAWSRTATATALGAIGLTTIGSLMAKETGAGLVLLIVPIAFVLARREFGTRFAFGRAAAVAAAVALAVGAYAFLRWQALGTLVGG